MSTTESGFSLVEVMVALAVISLVVVSGLAVVGRELETVTQSRHRIYAAALTEYKAIEMELMGVTVTAALATDAVTRNFEHPFGDYRWRLAIQHLEGGSASRQLELRVIWDGGEYSIPLRMRNTTSRARP